MTNPFRNCPTHMIPNQEVSKKIKVMSSTLNLNLARFLQDNIPNMSKADMDWFGIKLQFFWLQPENKDISDVDNVRIAVKGDSETQELYDARRDDGCCGSIDVEFGPAPSGKIYLYGFNYGPTRFSKR